MVVATSALIFFGADRTADDARLATATGDASSTPSSSTTSTSTTTTLAPAEQALAELNLRQKVGQLLVLQFSGEPSDETRRLLREGIAGSVFVTGRSGNFLDVDQATAMLASLQADAVDAGQPGLLVATDQEGGRVQQVDLEGLSDFPAASTYGAVAAAEGLPAAEAAVRADHAVMGAELAALGVNVDFAPVVDVNIVGDQGAIRDRSFSADAKVTSVLGAAAVEALQAEGVAATAKHFPGHGPTAVDSHQQLPVVERAEDEWWTTDAVPFASAIAADVGLVMIGHLFYPALDPHPEPRPASLSPAIITDLLRGAMGYDGVVVTDDLAAMAPVADLPLDELVVDAVNAGVDLLLTPSDVEAAHAVLLDAVQRGDVPRSTINAAALRVLTLKDRLGV